MPPRKADAERLAHRRVRAVAAGDVSGLDDLAAAVRTLQRARARRCRAPRNPRARSRAPPRRRARPGARSAAARARPAEISGRRGTGSSLRRVAECRARAPLAADPEVHRGHAVTAVDDRLARRSACRARGCAPERRAPAKSCRAPAARSMRRTGTFRRVSHSASTKPVGPAPTMSTGAWGMRCLSGDALVC